MFNIVYIIRIIQNKVIQMLSNFTRFITIDG